MPEPPAGTTGPITDQMSSEAPTPPPADTGASAGSMSDDLENFMAGTQAEKPTTPAAPDSNGSRKVDVPPVAPEKKQPATPAAGDRKTAENKPSTESPPEAGDKFGTEPEPKTPASLREAYAKRGAEIARLQTQVEAFQKHGGVPDREALLKQAEERDRQIKELQGRLVELDWTQSDDYKRQYVEPIRDLIGRGIGLVKQIHVTDRETGERRQGTPDDFMAVLGARDAGRAADMADEMFGGSKAAMILQYRQQINDIEDQRAAAAKDRVENGNKYKQLETAEEIRHREKQFGIFKAERERTLTKFGPLMTAAEDSDEEKMLLEKGERLADIAFLGCVDVSPEEMSKIQAGVYMRSSRFGIILSRLRKVEGEKKALEEKLGSYKKSQPGYDGTQSIGAGNETDSIENRWDKFMMGR